MADISKSRMKFGVQQDKGKLSANNKRRRSTVVMTTEFRERQNKLKARKEVLKARLSEEHKFILSMLAFKLDLSEELVADFCVESEEGVKLFDNFLEANGRRTLLFFYQEGNEESRIEISSRSIQSSLISESMELFITDGSTKPLTGLLLYFIKSTNTKALKISNIHEEVYFGSMDCSNGCGILNALSQVMSRVYMPALNALEKWGDLDNTSQGMKARDQFLKSINYFNRFVEATNLALCNTIELKKCDSINVFDYATIGDYYKVVNNPDEISQLEDLVQAWCKQIEQVLAESEQMRKEADDTGPIAELEHWRQRRAKFNTLLGQIKHQQCKTVIGILVLAKSKIVKIWRDLNNRITDSANEAKDNVKYLDTLEKSCQPLYESNPLKMIASISKLISAIQIIHSTSQYYNTPQRMTSLFIKVTNQMVTACKEYITDKNKEKIWDQPRLLLIEKLNTCNQLNREYQLCFQRTKKKIEGNSQEKPFEFSEMYIFGKFDTFCRRSQKIIELMRLIETYSILHVSKIEGIDAIGVRFEAIYKNMKKKPYDILDHRKIDFDHDFDDFKRYISEIDTHLQVFIDDCFEKMSSTVQGLQLLARFEILKIPSLKDTIDYKYDQLFMQFGTEIIKVAKIYDKYKDDPPIPRDMPPIAGKIAWARQLTYSIREPMSYFETRQSTILKKDALKIIHTFNRVAQAFLQFEVLYFDAWCKDVNSIKLGLQASLLVRYGDTFLVNFDPLITQLIRETDCLIKMGINVPESALQLFQRKDQLKEHHHLIKVNFYDLDKNIKSLKNLFLIFSLKSV